jgi:surface carbohydrate biosynthesis protein
MYSFKFINPKEIDVLIIDEIGSDMIVYCLPENAKFSVLPTRNVIPFIPKISFFYNIFKRLFSKQSIKKNILFSIIDTLKPKVMITFIDNSQIMAYLHSEFPEKLTISIQNGFRCEYKGGNFPRALGQFLFGFGDYEKKLLIKSKASFNEYIASGSLKYGIYRDFFYKEKNQIKNDICYISSYEERPIGIEHLELQRVEKKLFIYIADFCFKNNFTLVLAARGTPGSNMYEAEESYFKSLDVNNVLKIKPRDGVFGSYHLCSHSEIVVNSLSSLGLEFFGAGKKVLFGASENNFRLAKIWKSKKNFERMPSFVLLEELTPAGVAVKLKFLMDMEDTQYLDDTEIISTYYMNHRNDLYAYKAVKSNINDYLANLKE